MLLQITRIEKGFVPFDRPIQVDNGYGFKTNIDGFRMISLKKSCKSAEFYYCRAGLRIMRKEKRLIFGGGIVSIRESGKSYLIGEYTEVD